MKELYLYHATYKSNLNSILKNGLSLTPPVHNWTQMNCENKIFLAFNPYNAIAYAAQGNPEKKNEIIVLKVKYSELNDDAFLYDWNNRCEYYSDIDSCVYEDDIAAELLEICKVEDEDNQDFMSFKRTNLYNTILDTFDYEVETNKENC